MGVVARLTILGNGQMQTHAAQQDVCSVSKKKRELINMPLLMACRYPMGRGRGLRGSPALILADSPPSLDLRLASHE